MTLSYVLSALLALSVVLVTISAGFALARAVSRQVRREARLRLLALIARCRDFANGTGHAADLRAAANAHGEADFWAALERLSYELARSRRRRLTAPLERVRHVRSECRALRRESPWRRQLAARRLGLIHAPTARRALRRALRSAPEPVAFVAAQGLAGQRDARTLRWLLDHPDAFASRPPRARTALLRGFGAGASRLLGERLATGIDDPGLERAAIERLGAAGHEPAAAAIAARTTSPRLETRIAAARALGRIGSPATAPALIAALGDEAWQVRAQAARALGLVGATEAVADLARVLTDRGWWVRRHAAYALSALGEPGFVALRQAIHTSADPYAREIAAEALAAQRLHTRPA